MFPAKLGHAMTPAWRKSRLSLEVLNLASRRSRQALLRLHVYRTGRFIEVRALIDAMTCCKLIRDRSYCKKSFVGVSHRFSPRGVNRQQLVKPTGIPSSLRSHILKPTWTDVLLPLEPPLGPSQPALKPGLLASKPLQHLQRCADT